METNPWVIIRSAPSGVTIGRLVERDLHARAVTLVEARRIWQWRGANTLMELSMRGTDDETYTRISEPTSRIVILDVCEIIDVAPEAVPSLTRSRWAR